MGGGNKSIKLRLVNSSSNQNKKIFPLDCTLYIWTALIVFGFGGLVSVLASTSNLNQGKALNFAEIIGKYDSDNDRRLSSSEFEAYLRNK